MLIGTAACRVAKKAVPHLQLASILLASEAAGHHQCALVHSQGTEQLATFRAVATPASRGVAPKFGDAAHGLSAGISAYAGRPCSISRPWDLATTAAASFATNGSTGGAAGKNRKAGPWSSKLGAWNSKVDRRSSKGRSVKLITVGITSCASIQHLQQLVQQDGAHMNYINLAAALVKLQKLLSNLDTQQQQQVAQQSASLLDQLWQLQRSKLSQCGARQLANMIYSVCLLPTPLQQRYQWVIPQHLLPAVMRQLSSAKSQEVSNVLYGMAASGQQLSQQTTKLLIDQLVPVLRNASTQAIANALWAVATMQQQLQPIQLQQLADAFCAVAQKAKPQEIANTLWAVAAMKQQVEQVEQLDQMLSALVMQLGDAVPQDVSKTLLACAEFRYLPKQLLTAPALIDKLAAATPQALANTAWACGQLGYRDEQLTSALLHRVLDLVGTSEKHLISNGVIAQNVANLCWSLAVLDLREHAATVLILVQAAKPLWASMALEELPQLYQVHMWLTDHTLTGGQGLAAVLTAQQLEQCHSTWREMLDRTAASESGSFHQSVFSTLQSILIAELSWLVPPAMEQVSLGSDGQPDGAALIDITARTADGVWLAVEADGPTHFRLPDGGLMATTLYRNRALAVRGYVLISVPYYEWHGIQHCDKEQQQYLQNKITAALQQDAASKLRQQHLQPEDIGPGGSHPPVQRNRHVHTSSRSSRQQQL